MTRATDNNLTRLEVLLCDFTRACIAAAIIVGGSFIAGVLHVVIQRGGL